ncbi:MAG: ThuA domain-containing protein [Candidatus Marinimicrobia bacterium]|nr:ThuA domain-containing protein [Candidatus Neomarinimicrobiota bacterium]
MPAIPAEDVQKIERAVPAQATAIPQQPRKLLVFTRTEGYKHASIPYIATALQIMGEKTGAFGVVISEDMSSFRPRNLKSFDAVVFVNTTRLAFEDFALRQSLMDFVKGGKGIAGIHAATDNFYDWPEGAAMMGGLFDGHPWHSRGTWAIKLEEPDHPVLAAFKGENFTINDEIYRIKAPYSRVRVRVLMSMDLTDEATAQAKGVEPTDTDLPVSWVRSYGQGRVFYTGLGHNEHLAWNPVVLQHYLDGIQFVLGDLPAETAPSVSLEDVMSRLATYDYGDSRLALTDLTEVVRTAYGSFPALALIERRLLAFLGSGATLAAKQFVCRRLSLIGTEAAVPTLAAMLTDPSTSDMARYALERIPGDAVDAALLEALPKAVGNEKAGIINTLGQRRDGASVALLTGFILDSNPMIAASAVAALGNIAGPEAAEVLAVAKDHATGQLRLLVLDAYLKCADGFADQGDPAQANIIYRQLYASGENGPIRLAALRGLVQTSVGPAEEIIMEALGREEPDLASVAIGLVHALPRTENIDALVQLLPNLTVAGQVQLLTALARRGDPAHLAAVVNATRSADAEVRLTAIQALAPLGDRSTLDLLTRVATAGLGIESEAARGSIYRLTGPRIDKTILARIPEAEPDIKIELIRSIEHRRIAGATRTLFQAAADTDPGVRVEAIKVLKVAASGKDVPALVGLLVQAQSDAERRAAEQTVVVVAGKIAREDRRAAAVLAALPAAEDLAVRGSLLQVLGEIGDRSALPVLRASLADGNVEVQTAAIRALSVWPTTEPLPDLREIAKASGHTVHQVLALRGYVHLLSLESERSDEEAVGLYREALALAPNDSERRMVLSGLANRQAIGALELAVEYLDDGTLQQEAEVAVARIARGTYEDHPARTRDGLGKLVRVTQNEQLRNRMQDFLDSMD